MEILYQDDVLLVVNKPAGLSTLPDGYNPSLTSIKSLLSQRYGRVWVVHRLDKETSGVLLFARTADAHRSLNTQFEQHLVSKLYHALVVGSLDWQEQTIRLPLRPNGDRRHRTVVDAVSGKPSITRVKVLERFGEYTLLEVAPETGRPHQIRAHLSALGLQILGDKLYRSRKISLSAGKESLASNELVSLPQLAEGMGLHAFALEINHPTSGDRMRFTAPYPAWLADVLVQLRESHPVS